MGPLYGYIPELTPEDEEALRELDYAYMYTKFWEHCREDEQRGRSVV